MSFKSTEHEFESGNDVIKIIEFPFYPSEKTHGEFLPYKGYVDDVSVMGNPEMEQMLFLGTDDSLFWVKGNHEFIQKLEEAVTKWKEQWNLSSNQKVITNE